MDALLDAVECSSTTVTPFAQFELDDSPTITSTVALAALTTALEQRLVDIHPWHIHRLLAIWKTSPDVPILPYLAELFTYEPRASFDCREAPIVAQLIPGVCHRGYSIHMHINNANSTGALLRLMTEEGVGIDFAIHKPSVLVARISPEDPKWISLTDVPRHWFSFCFVHLYSKRSGTSQFVIYINGSPVTSKSPLRYPHHEQWTGKPLQLVVGGGFTGRIATVSVFGEPLIPRYAILLHIIQPDYQPRLHAQHSYSVAGYPPIINACYRPGSAFPGVPQLFTDPDLTFISRLLIHLTPHNAMGDRYSPDAFPSTSVELLQGVVVYKLVYLHSVFDSSGGLRLFLVAISPSFNGRKFSNEQECCAIITFLNELIRGSMAMAVELAGLGAIAIHNLIFQWIEPQFRTGNLLKATTLLLTSLDTLDTTVHKNLVLDLFTTTFLDIAFWSEAPLATQIALGNTLTTMMSANTRVFTDALGVQGLFYHISISVRTDCDSTPLLDSLIECVALMASFSDLDELLRLAGAFQLGFLQDSLLWIILSILLETPPEDFCNHIRSDHESYFLRILPFTKAKSSTGCIRGLKILGCFLLAVEDGGYFSRRVTSFWAQDSPCPLTDTWYVALMQIVLGQINTTNNDPIKTHSEYLIKLPEFLGILLSMISQSTDDQMVERRLNGIRAILEQNIVNQQCFTRNPFWQKFLIRMMVNEADFLGMLMKLELFRTSKTIKCACELLKICLWYCLTHESKGWVSFDQTIWLLNQSSLPAEERRFIKCTVFVNLVSQLVKHVDPLLDTAALLENLRPTLQLVENELFETLECFTITGLHSIDQQQHSLLEHFLIASLKFLPFPERRDHILRVVLRYIQSILPQKPCAALAPVILGAVSQVFGRLLGESSPKNLRVVQIAIAFLKNALRSVHHFDHTCALDIERTIQSLTFIWGTSVMCNIGSIGVAARDIEQVALSEEELFDISSQSFDLIRTKFVEVLQNRMRKIHAMLQDYSIKIEESSTVPGSAISAFETADSSRPWPATPSTMDALLQRNQFVMGRSVATLRKYHYSFISQCQYRYETSRAYWKIDPTESPSRMRCLLRRNFNGSDHADAASSHTSPRNPAFEVHELPAVIGTMVVQDQNMDPLLDLDDFDATPQRQLSKDEIKSNNLLADLTWLPDQNDDREEMEGPEQDLGYQVEEAVDHAAEPSVDSADKIILSAINCTLISPTRKIDGELTIYSERVSFIGKKAHIDPGSDSIVHKNLKFKSHNHVWLLKYIKQVLPRRYLLRECAIEIFTKKCRSFFLTFDKRHRNSVYSRMCSLLQLPYELSDMHRLSYSGMTQKWVNRQISNFEYLSQLNMIAGRSFNDLTQYPVFPAIISDYTSTKLDLTSPSTYRDLSKPIGALNPERLDAFRAKYQDMVEQADPAMPPFHYGSHYLSAGIVLYYLIRLEPFTTLNIELQGGKFDLPDRLFHSVAEAWQLSLDNLSDVKELIPEFFYLPEFLTNLSGVPLGTKQGGIDVGDVVLPPWAEKSPEKFIHWNRAALESEYVSAHLNEWIDLIFGYKQRGQAAAAADNLFFHLTYAGSVDIDSIADENLRDATIAQIFHFGQTPSQLFNEPHPVRRADIVVPSLAIPSVDSGQLSNIEWALPNRTSSSCIEISDPNTIDVQLSRMRSVQHAQYNGTGSLIWTSRSLLRISEDVSREISRESGPIRLSASGKFALKGGRSDGSLQCYLLPEGRLISSSFAGHQLPISHIAIDDAQCHVVTGASDGSIALWDVDLRRHNWARPSIQFSTLFGRQCGHVCAVSICTQLGIFCCVNSNGECHIFSIHRGSHIRSFELPFLKEEGRIATLAHISLSRRIVIVDNRGTVYMYSINASLLKVVNFNWRITVCTSTPQGGNFIVLAGESPDISFFDNLDLENIQNFKWQRQNSSLGGADLAQYVAPFPATPPPAQQNYSKSVAIASQQDKLAPANPTSVAAVDVDIYVRNRYPMAISISEKEDLMAVALSDGTVRLLELPNSHPDSAIDLVKQFAISTVVSVSDVIQRNFDDQRDQLMDVMDATAESAAVRIHQAKTKVWSAVTNLFHRS